MATTAWLVGAKHDIEEQSMEVTANGNQETITTAAGDYYPFDTASGNSYADVLCTALETHGDITTCTYDVLESGLIKFTVDIATAITFTDSDGRDLLGWTGNWSSGTAQTADNVSPQFWSPGKTESPQLAPLGVTGAPTSDMHGGRSGPGQAESTFHNEWSTNSFLWRHIETSRFQSSSEAPGEYVRFWKETLRTLSNWVLYRDIPEDTSGSSALTLGSYTRLGPYVCDVGKNRKYIREFPFGRSGAFGHTDIWHPVKIDCETVAEISNS